MGNLRSVLATLDTIRLAYPEYFTRAVITWNQAEILLTSTKLLQPRQSALLGRFLYRVVIPDKYPHEETVFLLLTRHPSALNAAHLSIRWPLYEFQPHWHLLEQGINAYPEDKEEPVLERLIATLKTELRC